jgi:hypothetical protein
MKILQIDDKLGRREAATSTLIPSMRAVIVVV